MENNIEILENIEDIEAQSERISEKISGLLRLARHAEIREYLGRQNSVDIAAAVSELETEELLRIFRIMPKDDSAEVFSYLDPDDQTRLVQSITDRELERLLDEMYLDDTVDFLEEVPANIVKRVLARSDVETRSLINRFLRYPDSSAGSIMTIEMVDLKPDMTAAQAIEHIRRTGVDKETVYTCYCIDPSRKLIGAVPLHSLLICPPETKVADIMEGDEQLIFVHTLDDREVVAALAKKYDLLSVPVVDNEKRLVGIITIDDIVDVIVEENTEDIEKMNLLRPSEYEYLKTGVFNLAKNRIIWLLVLMVSATFTGQIIVSFEDKLAAIVGLTACIPMLMDTGGNAGSQASTLIIRGLALGELKIRDYFRILLKELRVALICGVALAVVNFGRMFIIRAATGSATTNSVFMVVCLALFFTVVISKCIGCTLPIIAKLLKLDPALMAGPMLTTIVDALTLMVYFAFANLFLF